MDYSVKLARLPSDCSIPAPLAERLRYDADRGELIFRGFMTKCTYDELATLTDDADYHRALERLFVLTSNEVAPATNRPPHAAIAAATIVAAAIAAAALWMNVRPSSADQAAPQDGVVAVTSAAK